MAKKVVITADSTCDLSAELVEKYDIKIVPLYVNLDGTMYRDGVDAKPQMIYDLFAAKKILPKTSAPAVQDYIDYFNQFLDGNTEIVHINISGEMSVSCQNANLAAAEIGENVYVVDSRNLSTGIGHIVIEAAERAAQGMPAAQIKEEVEKLTDLVEASFVTSNLVFLYKGGRCSATSALMGTALNIKPGIAVRDGKMGVAKKYRGPFEKCLVKYVADQLQGRDDIDTRRIFITRSSETPKADKVVLEEIKKYVDFDEVYYTYAGCTICGHCGPDTLGILFMRKAN